MSWNYRILVKAFEEELQFGIYEVYYDDQGKPNKYSTEPIPVIAEDLDSLRWVVDMISACLSKPVLWYGDKFPQEYNGEAEPIFTVAVSKPSKCGSCKFMAPTYLGKRRTHYCGNPQSEQYMHSITIKTKSCLKGER